MTGAPERFEFTTVGNPTVVGSDPADAAADVALDAPIVVDFSTLMDTASVEAAIEVSPDCRRGAALEPRAADDRAGAPAGSPTVATR